MAAVAAVGRTLAAIAAAAVAMLSLSGCATSSLRTGRPIPEEQVRAIEPGTTTKTELFERFGPPAAVVARGEVATVATPAARSRVIGHESFYRFDASTFYELFPGAPKPDDDRRIYYYHHLESGGVVYILILAVIEDGKTTADRLWCLVNEKTRIVEDYAFKRSGSTVLFGLPRNGRSR